MGMGRLEPYKAIIVQDTIGAKTGSRITTFEIQMPKYLVAEFNTHRMLSRNSASSRAIPTLSLIRRVQEVDLLPIDWREKNTGMEAATVLSQKDSDWYDEHWLRMRDMVADAIREMLNHENENGSKGPDKQRVNRPLEAWMPTVIVSTATEWENFFYLRNSEFAQPEFAYIAKLMQDAYEASKPQVAYWHFPYVNEDYVSDEELFSVELPTIKSLRRTQLAFMLISAARCGRVSYYRQGETQTVEKDIQRGLDFARNRHWSPLEQSAKDQAGKWYGNHWGWKSLRKFFDGESGGSRQP